MPIGIDRFESDEGLGSTTSERVLRFLYAHDEQAFTRQEIADAIDRNPETVGTNLSRLKDANVVRHREPYWAALDDLEGVSEVLGRYGISVDELESNAEARSYQSDPDSGSPDPQETAAKAFFDAVRDSLGDAVEDLVLFGSVARGTAGKDSDVDVLAVVRDDDSLAAVDDELLDIAYDIQIECGITIEVHTIQASEYRDRKERGDPFVRRVLAEGQPDV